MKALVPRGIRQSITTAMVRAPIHVSDPARRVVVLLYHSIHASKSFASATPALFEEHMRWLKEHCNVIRFDEAPAVAAGSRRGRPSVAVTFDDGYADLHRHALPVLAEFAIPATIFLTTGLVDGDPRVISRMALLQAASADDVTGLTWSQIREMQEAEMTFGSHGIHHVNLARASDRRVRFEARTSKERLEDELGREVSGFAYPFGKPKHHFTARTMRLVASCGYRIAGSTNYRRVRATDDRMAVPRFAITMDPVEMLEAKVMGRLDLIGAYQQYAPLWAGRILSPETSVTK
jgi:peptidoglycan/xylan/chitin deacetylase (PgdA/CDA1 family)